MLNQIWDSNIAVPVWQDKFDTKQQRQCTISKINGSHKPN